MLFKRLRRYIAGSIIESKVKTIDRERAVFNLQSARSVGLIFSTVNPDDYNHIKNFISFLSQNDVTVTPIVFVEAKKIPDYYYLSKNLTIITRKDLNWLRMPREQMVHSFITNRFNILIDLTTEFHLPVFYIDSLSLAKYKIGRQIEGRHHFDLMIDTHENNTVQNLIEQIKYYTSVLKSPY